VRAILAVAAIVLTACASPPPRHANWREVCPAGTRPMIAEHKWEGMVFQDVLCLTE